VLRTAQLGGHLVYQHGIGVEKGGAAEATPSASPEAGANGSPAATPSGSQATSATPTPQ
jgi:hypothetical protein